MTERVSEISVPHHPRPSFLRMHAEADRSPGPALATLAPNLSIIEWLPLLSAKRDITSEVWIVEPSTLTYANSYHSRNRPATDFVGMARGKSPDDMDDLTESTGRLLPFSMVLPSLCVPLLFLHTAYHTYLLPNT